ncbi:tRNA 2-thiouridine(34) synthase MnmA [Carboxylicivirga linearis]|uniref:tRNA-specific 2-thiouridylase MnmA n=1 Tax=Carboxylicivirga linearis TaxID=1628157 RepID=A0ABS5JVW8_9BACT|nr:tRNA 2-thiouridine(34) synthase MnmA [Carboxylicivirga linearis]MBS2098989.1 tRNA 2-thiouridine(34) synthase MnmA [Carboxylicivirga linearis]
MKKRVILGMSGGMDSSMSAILLQRQGYEVIGATLQTHTEANDKNIVDAQNLAKSLQIEHHLIDCRNEFKKEVITYFADEYINGRTPNPCVYCNRTIKWKYLLDLALQLDCDHIATGHYVRVLKENKYFYIQKGMDPAKDQSYFLWNLSQDVLSKAIFPLGQLKKTEVRALASELGYQNIADKKESMGVCFLAGTDYRNYLKKLLTSDHPSLQPGPVIDSNNNVLGHHEGFPFYTIGQKRGIEGVANGQCVVSINPERRALITGKKSDLFTNQIHLHEYSLTTDKSLWQDREVFIRVRGLDSVPGYQGKIEINNNSLAVYFNEDVWAITPGQSIVFYQDDKLIGGGIS